MHPYPVKHCERSEVLSSLQPNNYPIALSWLLAEDTIPGSDTGIRFTHSTGSMSFRFASTVLPNRSKFDRGNKEVVPLDGAHIAGSYSR